MKAVGLFSGGLDSTLAAKLIQKQGIKVEVLILYSPFFNLDKKNCFAVKSAKENKIPFKLIDLGIDYMKIVKKPKHGYGKNLNPCIDCKIFMLKKAKKYADKIKAEFVFTGEVLNQRPKSQHRGALDIIANESGLKDRLLRPLSAKLLDVSLPEKKGVIDREKLLDINGKGRKRQIELAGKLGIKHYLTPSGGCLLTEKRYCDKLRDLLGNKNIKINDLYLLKKGRHFRIGKNKIIVGRDEKDNNEMMKLKNKSDLIFEVKDYVGPTTILQGKADKKIVELAASLTARYSDAEKDKVAVGYGKGKLDKKIIVKKINERRIDNIRI